MKIKLTAMVLLTSIVGAWPSHGDAPLESRDLRTMHLAYEQSHRIFARDYVGKMFVGSVEFRGLLVMFNSKKYRVGFGTAGTTTEIDCIIEDTSTLDQIAKWHAGDMIRVSGVVAQMRLGSVKLDNCEFQRAEDHGYALRLADSSFQGADVASEP